MAKMISIPDVLIDSQSVLESLNTYGGDKTLTISPRYRHRGYPSSQFVRVLLCVAYPANADTDTKTYIVTVHGNVANFSLLSGSEPTGGMGEIKSVTVVDETHLDITVTGYTELNIVEII